MYGLAASLVLIAGVLLLGGILTAGAAALVMFIYRREDFPTRETPVTPGRRSRSVPTR